MPKDINRLPPENHNTAISDYPDLVSDTSVVFGHAHIIPDVIDNVTDKVEMVVDFGSIRVENGMELDMDAIATEPKVVIRGASHGDTYSLVLVDPDMPSPHKPKYRDTLYWMVNNIKGGDFEAGEFTVEYMPPEPATGTHRYVFLLYSQNQQFKTFHAPSVRVSFQTKQWAKDHGLGDPVAGVYFKAKHD